MAVSESLPNKLCGKIQERLNDKDLASLLSISKINNLPRISNGNLVARRYGLIGKNKSYWEEFIRNGGSSHVERYQYFHEILGLTLRDISQNNNIALRRATSSHGDSDILQYLISLKFGSPNGPSEYKIEGLNFDDIKDYDNEAFIWTLRKGHLHIIKYLVSQGLSLDDIREYNSEGMRTAAEYGFIDILKYLVSLELTIDDLSIDYHAPLRKAIGKNYLKVVKYLVSLGSNIEHLGMRRVIIEEERSKGNIDMVNYLKYNVH